MWSNTILIKIDIYNEVKLEHTAIVGGASGNSGVGVRAQDQQGGGQTVNTA